jgi:diguanylate cyclase (GGDEF)-like protein
LQAYTAVLLVLVGMIFVIVGATDRRKRWLLTCSLPLGAGACAAALMTDPSLLPGLWALQLAGAFLLAVHGFGWQVVRRFQGRSSVVGWAIGLPVAWLLFSVFICETWQLPEVSAAGRALVTAIFNGLSARELVRERSDALPSRALLRASFLFFLVVAALRIALSALLPTPLGGLPSTAWAVVAFNVLAIAQLLLTAALLIILVRERETLESERLTLRDPLTGLLNRRAYDQEASLAAARAMGRVSRPIYGRRRRDQTSGGPLTLLVFDIDRFKSVNDRFGHDVGDQVIRLAAKLAESVRSESDSVYRVGGEEFVCLLRNASAERGMEVAERLRGAFEFAASTVDGLRIGATLSLGVASSDDTWPDIRALFTEADKALYAAKHAGRNRSVLAPSLREAA